MAYLNGNVRCTLLILVCCIGCAVTRLRNYSVENFFKSYAIVPNLVPYAPWEYLYVDFPSGISVELGNIFPPGDSAVQPDLVFNYDEALYYTVILIDPDVPSFRHKVEKERIHWLVTNVKGNDVKGGDTIVQYKESRPIKYSGIHRYVFLVYSHPFEVKYAEPISKNITLEERDNFSIKAFVKEYNLTELEYGNFYRCYYDYWQP